MSIGDALAQQLQAGVFVGGQQTLLVNHGEKDAKESRFGQTCRACG